ncbi:hypothetical protein ASC74_16430 [Pseudomonas sp. Root329]|nr:hypothetical protein ASC74_16430 [Pseudomonas sp. Root329]
MLISRFLLYADIQVQRSSLIPVDLTEVGRSIDAALPPLKQLFLLFYNSSTFTIQIAKRLVPEGCTCVSKWVNATPMEAVASQPAWLYQSNLTIL